MSLINIETSHMSSKQLAYLSAEEDFLLFGGARGGGKTYISRYGAMIMALKNPGKDVVFVRKTIKSARKQYMKGIREILPRSVTDAKGKVHELWREDKKNGELHIANGPDPTKPFDGGATIIFAGVDTLQEAMEHQGMEYVGIFWDELAKSEIEAITYMFGQLRNDSGTKPIFRGTANPGDKSHADIKKMFVDPYYAIKRKYPDKFPAEYSGKISWKKKKIDDKTGKEIFTSYAYIPATLDDNPNESVREQYLQILLNLPDHLREMYRNGSWDTFEGKMWNNVIWDEVAVKTPDVEVMLGGKLFDLVQRSKIYVSWDWGRNDNTAVLFHFEHEYGITVTFDRVYVNDMNIDEITEEVIAKMSEWEIQPSKAMCYSPHDAFWKKGIEYKIGDEVVGEALIDVWRRLTGLPSVKASNNRIAGWTKVSEMLTSKTQIDADGTSLPSHFILKDRVPELFAQLNALQVDPKSPEDVKKNMEDDAADAFRYFAVAFRKNSETPHYLKGNKETAKGRRQLKIERIRKSNNKKRQTSFW